MYSKPRERIGFIIKRKSSGHNVYSFKYATIKKGGPKGVWQFEWSYYRGKRVPHIFFTCPFCGKINKDYLSLSSILERINSSAWLNSLRYCHNCRFCRKQVPYTLHDNPAKIRREYRKLEKLA